jgi:hypothetical protein
VVEGFGVARGLVVPWVVAVRPSAHPTRRYKYVAGDRITPRKKEAAKYATRAKARILAAQVRILSGGAYRVVVLRQG